MVVLGPPIRQMMWATCYGMIESLSWRFEKRVGMERIHYKMIAILGALILLLTACAQNTEAQWQEQYDLGVRYLSDGNYEEAIIAFTAAIEIDPKQPDAYMGASEAYMAMGDTEAAISILEEGFTETNSEEIRDKLDEIMPANNSTDGEEVRQFPLTYQMIDSGGIVPEVEDIYYEVYTTNGAIDQEMNSTSTRWVDGMTEETLFGSVIVDLVQQQYNGTYYVNTYFEEDEISQRVEDCVQYIYGIENGQFSNYEEMLQIYGNDDRAGGSTSLWLDSNEWYIGVEVFDAEGDQLGYAFFALGTAEEIQNIKEFGMLRIS